MSIKPLADRVVVEPLEAEEKTPGGILIPDTAREKPVRGKVIVAGPGRILDDGTVRALTVKEGDLVLYTKWAGDEVELDQKKFKIMREADILATLDES